MFKNYWKCDIFFPPPLLAKCFLNHNKELDVNGEKGDCKVWDVFFLCCNSVEYRSGWTIYICIFNFSMFIFSILLFLPCCCKYICCLQVYLQQIYYLLIELLFCSMFYLPPACPSYLWSLRSPFHCLFSCITLPLSILNNTNGLKTYSGTKGWCFFFFMRIL